MTRHVRILVGWLDRGAGSHVYHRELAVRLASRGYRVSVVCFEAVPEVLECAEVTEVRPSPFEHGRLTWRLASWLQYRHCSRELLARPLPPADVVVGGEHLFLKAHRRKFPGTPWIYLPHSMVVAREIAGYGLPRSMHVVANQVYGRLQRWALRHANLTLRFTRRACQVMAEHYGGSLQPRFVVNPIGIDLPENSSVKPPGETELRLLILGRLIPSKGVDTALTALAGQRRRRWRLDVVGDGPLRGELERRAYELGIADRVHFHGFEPDPSSWYARSDLLLFPSRSESLGLVLLEAMGHGVPCLAIRADGAHYWNVNDEVIDDGRIGLLADGEAGFARLLESVLDRPDQLPPLGQAARRHVAENHTWDAHLDRYEEFFEPLLGGHLRRAAVEMGG